VIANEQRVHLGQPQRAGVVIAGEPALDAITMLRDLAPLLTRRDERAGLHALRDLVHLLVGQLAAALETEARRRRRVAPDRLAVDAGLAADPPVALPRRPAPEHFLHVDHRQLPEAHRFLRDGDRRRRHRRISPTSGRSLRVAP
jgi:hypothetical protein